MRVFVTGGTGLIGSHIVRALAGRGDRAVVLSRDASRAALRFAELGVGDAAIEIVEGNPQDYGAWAERLAGCHAVLNLAGEPVFGRRWTAAQRRRLRDSRVVSTANVVRALGELGEPQRPRTLVNASAVGYYGSRGDQELTEDDQPGSDFLAETCVEWEAAARQAEQHAVRVAIIRVGVVLDAREGALRRMLTPFRWGLGGKIASGRQWLSWIHRDDIVGLFLLAIDHPAARGAINGTAPEPVQNKEFSKTLASVLHRPCLFRIPALALRARFGRVADVITKGQRVLPRTAQALGYEFRYPTVRQALDDLLRPE